MTRPLECAARLVSGPRMCFGVVGGEITTEHRCAAVGQGVGVEWKRERRESANVEHSRDLGPSR